MNTNTRSGLEIQTINNGYLVTGHKTDGYNSVDTGSTFFSNFEELAESLVGILRQTFDLDLPQNPDLFGYGFQNGLVSTQ